MKNNKSRNLEKLTTCMERSLFNRSDQPPSTTRILFLAMGIIVCLSGRVFAGPEKIVPVVPSTVQLVTPIEKVPLPGSAFPWKESDLSTQVDGLVLEVLVDDGDRVKKGDLLIRLDNTIARLETREAKAALEESRAAYEDAVRQRDEAAKLVKKRHVAETTYQSLIAESKIKLAERERLEAEYHRTAELASRYRIIAPFDGVVGTVSVEIGQWVESGDAVIKLFRIDTLKIRVSVPQRFYSKIDPGTPVAIHFDALEGPAIEATVSRKIPIGNPDARTFPIRIDLPNPDYRIAPGMSAKVVFRIEGDKGKQVLSVPRDALVTSPDGSESLWKIERGNRGFSVQPVPVKSGRFFGESVEIAGGNLDPGDLVVVRGNEILKPGQTVRLLDPRSE